MKCSYCGEEIREGARFCTQCGMPVVPIVQMGPDASPEADDEQAPEMYKETTPETQSAEDTSPLGGYMSYTSGERRKSKAAPQSSPYAPDKSERNDRSWAAGVALACAVFALTSAWFVLPGIVLGTGAIVFGCMGKNSSLKPLAIGSIIGGILAVIVSAAMIFAWIGTLELIWSFIGEFSKYPIFY